MEFGTVVIFGKSPSNADHINFDVNERHENDPQSVGEN